MSVHTLSSLRLAFNMDQIAVDIAVSFKPSDNHRFCTILTTLAGGLHRSSKASISTQSKITS